MTLRNRIAVVCMALPALVELGLGVIYVAASEPMPYHKAALGVDWAQVVPGTRLLLVTLVNGYGSAHLGVGIALGVLILGPLRQGQPWARWAVLAAGLPVLGATACLSTRLALTTGADVPWRGAVALVALFIVGVAMVHPKGARPADPASRLTCATTPRPAAPHGRWKAR